MSAYNTSDSKSPSDGQDSEAQQKNRPPFVKCSSVDQPDTGASAPMNRQKSTSTKRSQYSRRQSKSFDFPHVDSMAILPCVEGLESLNLNEVPWWTSHRVRLAILTFAGFICMYAQRVNLSIAIVSMVSHHYRPSPFQHLNNSNISVSLGSHPANTTMSPLSESEQKCPSLSTKDKEFEFNWSKQQEGLILGAFFWGYLVFQIPGGRLSEMFGAKRVIAIAMFPVSILSLISPFAARTSPYLFLVVRVFVGLGEGVVYPAAQALWSKWAPPNERSRLIGFSYAGGQFGNAIIFPIGGLLCAYGFDGGWPTVFYFVGGTGFIWCVFWMILAHDSPDKDPTITELEKKYIIYSLGNRSSKSKVTLNLPWKAILTSRAVWAILVAHMCGNYGAYMLLTKLPAYMKEVLKFDVKANGAFSMMPYLAFWFVITISGLLADFFISKGIMSVGVTRKVMSIIGMVGPAVFLVGTSYMECDQQVAAVIMLTISVGLCGFHFSGYFINHGDIAPPYAGTLFGLSNMLATIPGIFSPYVVSAMTKNGTREEWQLTFYLAAGIYAAGALWYVILGKGEIEDWSKDHDIDDEEGNGNFDLDAIKESTEEANNSGTTETNKNSPFVAFKLN